jgi:hypothetical protein
MTIKTFVDGKKLSNQIILQFLQKIHIIIIEIIQINDLSILIDINI